MTILYENNILIKYTTRPVSEIVLLVHNKIVSGKFPFCGGLPYIGYVTILLNSPNITRRRVIRNFQ